MSKDPFEMLADELTLIRRDIERLQRTSLDKTEAQAVEGKIQLGLENMITVGDQIVAAVHENVSQTATELKRQSCSPKLRPKRPKQRPQTPQGITLEPQKRSVGRRLDALAAYGCGLDALAL